jgi:hypothetical protein
VCLLCRFGNADALGLRLRALISPLTVRQFGLR